MGGQVYCVINQMMLFLVADVMKRLEEKGVVVVVQSLKETVEFWGCEEVKFKLSNT